LYIKKKKKQSRKIREFKIRAGRYTRKYLSEITTNGTMIREKKKSET